MILKILFCLIVFFNDINIFLNKLLILYLYLDNILEMTIISISLGINLLASSLGKQELELDHTILMIVAATTTIFNNKVKSKDNSNGW